MIDKNLFPLDLNQAEAVLNLSDEQAGRLLKGIYRYQKDGLLFQEKGTVKDIFIELSNAWKREAEKETILRMVRGLEFQKVQARAMGDSKRENAIDTEISRVMQLPEAVRVIEEQERDNSPENVTLQELKEYAKLHGYTFNAEKCYRALAAGLERSKMASYCKMWQLTEEHLKTLRRDI